MSEDDGFPRQRLRDMVSARAFGATVRVLGLLPYRSRVALSGRFFAEVVAPLAGWRQRIRANLRCAKSRRRIRREKRTAAATGKDDDLTLLQRTLCATRRERFAKAVHLHSGLHLAGNTRLLQRILQR